MSSMAKDGGDRFPPKEPGAESLTRGRGVVPEGRNHLFVRAFADALRDILREEQRRSATA